VPNSLPETIPRSTNEEDTRELNSPPNQRLLSLDVFRGVTVAAMILVTDPGTYASRYAPLCHSDWVGPTSTDMIFPAFLVAVGIAMTLSFASRVERGADRARLLVHALRRTVLLIALGFLVNGFPDYHWHTIRIPGILQHIALCYLLGSLIYLAVSRYAGPRRMIIVAAATAAVLSVHWALLMLVPVPGFGAGRLDSLGNLGAYMDRSVLGVRHMWIWGTTPGHGVTFDPDGLLLTLSSLGNLLIGVLAGEWLRTHQSRTRKAIALIAAGGLLMIVGWALSPWMPLNKKLWTSTFTLLSSGVALMLFACFYWLLDGKRNLSDVRRWLTLPALIFGTNAILAFVISGVITTLFDRVHVTAGGGLMTLHQWGYQYGFATWLRPINASLAYALVVVLLNLAILYPLYRRRIFLRV
jgi:predicted acyltransferase